MNSVEKPPRSVDAPEEGEVRWIKRGLGIAAATAVVAVGGLVGERLIRDDFVEINPTQREELSAVNHQLLTRFSVLSFDVSGHVQRALMVGGNPEYQNALDLQLKVEGDTFVIDGEGRHSGVTQQTHTRYDDPAAFHLAYQLPEGSNVQAIPAELLKQVMESGQMPSEVDYTLTEKRLGYGRYDVEDGLDDKGSQQTSATMRVDDGGELTAIQIGKAGSLADSQDLTDKVEGIYDDIIDELERVGL